MRKNLNLRANIALGLIFAFLANTFGPIPVAQADPAFSGAGPVFGGSGELHLPAPGTMVNLSPAYEPTLIKGLIVHKDNPFLFDFIVDTGHSGLAGNELKKEGDRLVKYFFACLTIPEKDLWVNLSPYEKDRMVPQALGQTALGRDLLAQDYILKQLTASLIYPEKDLGKSFWDRVYTKARQMYGTTQIPVNTFNKVWIVADKASVYEHGQTAFVVSGHMKVMLEEDYLALQKHNPSVISTQAGIHSVGSQIVRTVILPEIEKEVNTGKNFATLRQIFNSLILASWYKKNLKEALLTQVYADHSKVKGIERPGVIASGAKQSQQDLSPKQIYEQYLKAYKKGVFNYIKEDSQPNGQTIPRKYFSGGFDSALVVTVVKDPADAAEVAAPTGNVFKFNVGIDVNNSNLTMTTPDAAMTVTPTRKDPVKSSFVEVESILLQLMYTDLKPIPNFNKENEIEEARVLLRNTVRTGAAQQLADYLIGKEGAIFKTQEVRDEINRLLSEIKEKIFPNESHRPTTYPIREIAALKEASNLLGEARDNPYEREYMVDLARYKLKEINNPLADTLGKISHSAMVQEIDKVIERLNEKRVDALSKLLAIRKEGTLISHQLWEDIWESLKKESSTLEFIPPREISFRPIQPWEVSLKQGTLIFIHGGYFYESKERKQKEHRRWLKVLFEKDIKTFEKLTNEVTAGKTVEGYKNIREMYDAEKKNPGSIIGHTFRITTREGDNTTATMNVYVQEITKSEIKGLSYDNSGVEGERTMIEGTMTEEGFVRAQEVDAAVESDKATVTEAPKNVQGGIDLNTSNGMQWKISKDGNGVEMNIDPAMIERVRREGIDNLSPVILRITPVTSIWPLVGLQAPEKG